MHAFVLNAGNVPVADLPKTRNASTTLYADGGLTLGQGWWVQREDGRIMVPGSGTCGMFCAFADAVARLSITRLPARGAGALLMGGGSLLETQKGKF